MRKLLFLLPGTTGKFACGGLWAELKTVQLAQQICPVEVVTYRQRETGRLFLADLLQQQGLNQVIFVASWGFDLPKLLPKLKQFPVVYHAHSAGYGFDLPARIPIITVSRNTMGYWGQRSPHALIYYLPNQISDHFSDHHQVRDIDVLVQARKSSTYLLQQLIPALQQQCRVEMVDTYVEDIAELFNRSRVYLYDSAEYWAQQRISEGFGLQPMEAMACGCHVFSSLNGGLSDYLDPGFNSHKIAAYSLEFDRQRILKVVQANQSFTVPPELLAEYRTENIIRRLTVILEEINQFFDQSLHPSSLIPPLSPLRITQLNMQRLFKKIQQRYLTF